MSENKLKRENGKQKTVVEGEQEDQHFGEGKV